MTVGFYGDPGASWSILLEADLKVAPDPAAISARMATAAARHPDLGEPPRVREPSDWDDVRAEFADSRYFAGDSLVRVAAGDRRLLIAAHHAAVDGLGLLALLGIALGDQVRSEATGVDSRTPERSFLRTAASRLREAVFTPPTRIQPDRRASAAGDRLICRELGRTAVGSARLAAGAMYATRRWNTAHGKERDRIVAAVGASHRGGANLRPEAASTFFRLRLPPDADTGAVRTLLAGSRPEPDFPTVVNPLARLGIKVLAPRLGSTFLASNLGVVHAGEQVRALRFYPSASGRSGVAFGAVTTGHTTTVTLRARRRDFGAGAADELLGLLCDSLVADRPARRHG